MSVQVRTFDGTAAELEAFTLGVWRENFHGKSMYPRWSNGYFDWQLLAYPNDREYILAAYDDARLVGFFAAEQFTFTFDRHPARGTMASWLTVDPHYRHAGVGRLLNDEMKNRHRARNALFMGGYVDAGSVRGQGRRFWKGVAADAAVLPRPRFWVRVLDADTVARAEYSRTDAAAARLASVVVRKPRATGADSVRPYRPDDIVACFELWQRQAPRVDVGYLWDVQRLAHQLAFEDIPQTLVYERSGAVAGFVNFYFLPFVGRVPFVAAIVDFIVCAGMSLRERRALLAAAVRRTVGGGAAMALVLGPPCHDVATLLAGGFLPGPRTHYFIVVPVADDLPLKRLRTARVHWR